MAVTNQNLTFTPVIGIEIHIQLKTGSKMFCSCPADHASGEPNSRICPVCMGLPGTLPVMNRAAAHQGMLAGMALNCEIQPVTFFSRKAYYYPDLPKGFQTSGCDMPIALNGWIEVKDDAGNPKKIRIHCLHIEEDVGKLLHSAADGRLEGAEASFVDYNRAGLPLAEIVSEPDVSSAREAVEFVTSLRRRVRYAGASDVDLEKGMMRFDANVSTKCSDGRWGRKVEVKNMNSFRALERAIEYEIKRQSKILEEGGEVAPETRHWNDAKGVTTSSRSKAFARRFMPEVDLPPLVVSAEWIEKARASLPEMPESKISRYVKDMGLSGTDAAVLTDSLDVAEYFEACVKAGANPARAGNWVRTEVLRVMNEKHCGADELAVRPDALAGLIRGIDGGRLSTTVAKKVFEKMLDGLTLDEAVEKLGVAEGGVGSGALDAIVGAVLAANPDVAEEIKSGKDAKGKKIKFLQGLVMREAKGQARPEDVAKAVAEAVAGSPGSD